MWYTPHNHWLFGIPPFTGYHDVVIILNFWNSRGWYRQRVKSITFFTFTAHLIFNECTNDYIIYILEIMQLLDHSHYGHWRVIMIHVIQHLFRHCHHHYHHHHRHQTLNSRHRYLQVVEFESHELDISLSFLVWSLVLKEDSHEEFTRQAIVIINTHSTCDKNGLVSHVKLIIHAPRKSLSKVCCRTFKVLLYSVQGWKFNIVLKVRQCFSQHFDLLTKKPKRNVKMLGYDYIRDLNIRHPN